MAKTAAGAHSLLRLRSFIRSRAAHLAGERDLRTKGTAVRTVENMTKDGGAAALRDEFTTALADRIVAAATPARVVGVVQSLRVPLIELHKVAPDGVAGKRRGAQRCGALNM